MQQTYRANLTAAEFPMLSELQGRTIITANQDQNYSRQANSPKNKDRDIGIPQVYYMHNVMPTDAGLSSVAYRQITTPPAMGDSTFGDIYTIRDINENVAHFCNTSSGRCYVMVTPAAGWLRTTDISPAVGRTVSIAHVNGQTYVCFGGTGTYKYNFATNVMTLVTLTGTNPANIMGVCASSGYMVAWTDNTVIWSSIVDPTDFTPSLVTGAGGGGVQNAKAAVVVCIPQNNGFIVYTKRNAVAAFYTNNAQYPFNYKEIMGAGGLNNSNLVAFDGNSTDHYAYTTAGLQDISLNNSAIIFPQVTDFIAGSQFEDFDELTGLFSQILLSTTMVKKLVMVTNRYFVVSYGISSLTHALIFDTSLARWGKLKISHVDCFEYFIPSASLTETPKQSIGFLAQDGSIFVAISNYATVGSYGTVVLGKYQLDRDHFLNLQELHLESIKTGSALTVKVFSSTDGTNTTTIAPYLAGSTGNFRRYHCRTSALNHSINITGAFHLNSLELKYSQGGLVR